MSQHVYKKHFWGALQKSIDLKKNWVHSMDNRPVNLRYLTVWCGGASEDVWKEISRGQSFICLCSVFVFLQQNRVFTVLQMGLLCTKYKSQRGLGIYLFIYCYLSDTAAWQWIITQFLLVLALILESTNTGSLHQASNKLFSGLKPWENYKKRTSLV